MKQINAYEFKNLPKDIAKKVYEGMIGNRVEQSLEWLNIELNDEEITEEQYYKELGCSKAYAELTPWFVPSCYYENNARCIKELVKEDLSTMLFDSRGNVIG